MSSISGTLAINKAIDVIEVLTSRPQGSTQTEILGLLPITRRTLHRILYSLCERGLAVQHEGTKKFYISDGSYQNSAQSPVDAEDWSLAHVSKFLFDLTAQLRTPAAIYCRDGHNALVVFKSVPGDASSRTFTPEGLLIPVGSIIPTFGILVFMSDEEINAIIDAHAFYINDNNLLSREHIFSAVKRIRQYGFICCQGCIFPHMSNVVFPLTLKNNCHASLCVQIERDEKHDAIRDIVLRQIQDALHRG